MQVNDIYIMQYPCGLLNQGNTCYINSFLQLFFLCPELMEILNTKPKTRGTITNIFKTISRIIFSKGNEEGHVMKLTLFLNKFKEEYKNFFVMGRQQDSHEAIMLFILTLHEQLKETFTNKNLKFLMKEAAYIKKDIKKYRQSYKSIYENDYSAISNIFFGHTMSTLKCNNCNDVSQKIENFKELVLSIDDKDVNTLEQALDIFFNEEIIEDKKCEKCKKTKTTYRKYNIVSYPKYLFITFSRYKFNMQRLQYIKNQKFINFPNELDISNYIIENNDNKHMDDGSNYSLKGFINHMGVAGGGHYTATCKYPTGWYECDDENPRLLSQDLKDIHKRHAYILLYEKK